MKLLRTLWKHLVRFIGYLRPVIEGTDNKPSGKRLLAYFFALIAVHIAVVSVGEEKLNIINAFLLACGAFFGLTAWQTIQTNRHDTKKPDSTTPPDSLE